MGRKNTCGMSGQTFSLVPHSGSPSPAALECRAEPKSTDWVRVETEPAPQLTFILFFGHDSVTQGKEAKELMCMGVPHLDSLQEAGVPK